MGWDGGDRRYSRRNDGIYLSSMKLTTLLSSFSRPQMIEHSNKLGSDACKCVDTTALARPIHNPTETSAATPC